MGLPKVVVAAAHFNRLAEEKGLAFVAVSRGTTPDAEIAQPAVTGLLSDGIDPPSEKPAKLSPSEVSKALRVVSFCDLPKDIKTNNVERWTVPPISEDYPKARDAIVHKLNELIHELTKSY
jgi:arsenate reductase